MSALAVIGLAGSLLAGPVPAQAAPVSPAALEECLVRSAIVPLEAATDAAPDDLREAAARTLQFALLTQQADTLTAAELVRADDGTAIGISLTPVTGAAATDAPVARTIATLDMHLRTAAAELSVDFAPAVDHTLAMLCEALDGAMQIGGEAGAAIVSASIDHRTATLRVGLDSEAPLRSSARLEELPRAIDGSEPVTREHLANDLGLDALGVPLELIADVADAPTSRLHDNDGYGGGNAIRVGAGGGYTGLACTTGFAVRTSDGASAVMSAGHCAGTRGGNGATVVSGHAPAYCGLGSGSRIGSVSQNLLTSSSRIDSMVIRTSSARPTMWLGSRCGGSGETPVHGTSQVRPGQAVGFSGSRQGERWGIRTSEPAGCYDFGYWACSILRATSTAPANTSGYVCLPGDSGGPVFRSRDGGGVFAIGLISASGYDLGINRCNWVDMGAALHRSGATIMTQTSMTMSAPSRIAGDDRYETASLIAQRGYPSGARQVWVASGERFPDALSAGAAAAHVRAPLLLTARGSLPSSTSAAVTRMRPTSIVLVGGTPSVSAEVEAALSRIAPVTRIAGADRYETSALIARHAFEGGATGAFIATGRGFPDALAAGPVAALRQAPMLLVDGRGTASQHTLDALTDLGTTHLTVIGGVPSVSAAVAAEVGAGRSVSRIAGADRYATAIRVNWAYSPRPSTFYIAAGNRFPDALAASAVAGAQGAPLYLTPSSCLASSLPPEHRRLGAPPVVLLGGTPSLTHDVTRYELCG